MQTEKFAWYRPWFNLETGRKRNPLPGEQEAERSRIAALLVGKVCRWTVSFHEDRARASDRWGDFGPGTVGEINLLDEDELEVVFFRDGDPNDRDGRRLHMMEIEYIVSPD